MLVSSMIGRAKDHYQTCRISVVFPNAAASVRHGVSTMSLMPEVNEVHAALLNKVTAESEISAIGSVRDLSNLSLRHIQALLGLK